MKEIITITFPDARDLALLINAARYLANRCPIHRIQYAAEAGVKGMVEVFSEILRRRNPQLRVSPEEGLTQEEILFHRPDLFRDPVVLREAETQPFPSVMQNPGRLKIRDLYELAQIAEQVVVEQPIATLLPDQTGVVLADRKIIELGLSNNFMYLNQCAYLS